MAGQEHIKKAGLIESPERAAFRITKAGLDVLHDDPNVIDQKYLLRYDSFKEFIGKEEKVNLQSEIENDQIDTLDDILESSYQKINQSLADDVLNEVLKLSPVAFEKMVLDLMEKMGYGTYSTAWRNNDEGMGSGIPKLMKAMREYGLREPEFRDMEIGFRINFYRNTDALEDISQGAEKTTQVIQDTTQGNTQVRLTEEDKEV